MIKKFSVIILAVIQLIFCISLAIYNPVLNWLIDKNGKEYYFKFNYVSYYELYDDNSDVSQIVLCCYYDASNDEFSTDYKLGKYAAIKTDSNGFSLISNISDKKPKDTPYIKNPKNVIKLTKSFDFTFDENIAEKLSLLGIFRGSYWRGDYSSENEITVKMKIYNGYYSDIGEIYIDGIPIGDYITNL